jgi:hypothetical protein
LWNWAEAAWSKISSSNQKVRTGAGANKEINGTNLAKNRRVTYERFMDDRKERLKRQGLIVPEEMWRWEVVSFHRTSKHNVHGRGDKVNSPYQRWRSAIKT